MKNNKNTQTISLLKLQAIQTNTIRAFFFHKKLNATCTQIKERGSVPPRPEKTHKTVVNLAECYKCVLCVQSFFHFSPICISAIN